MRPVLILALAPLAAVCALAAPAVEDKPAAHLSQWLLSRQARASDYLPSLILQKPQEAPAQESLKRQLLQGLSQHREFDRLRLWLQQLPVTGRVKVAAADGVWLAAHPAQNPELTAQDALALAARPHTVTVVLENGRYCQPEYQAGALAAAYIASCTSDVAAREQVWIAQPNGQQWHFGMGLWNAQSQLPPAPGAWLWAPRSDSAFEPQLSQALIRFLATQGLAPDDLALQGAQKIPARPVGPAAATVFFSRDRDPRYSTNDWGEVGLLQTPTARMFPAGSAAVSVSHTSPYTRINTLLQPLEGLEIAFRYSDISDRAYDPSGTISQQSLKDKSLSVKWRLLEEQRYTPALAIGARDIGGTGLFSGEYLVASKRTGDLDWSLGMGWGYVGARANLSHPLSWLSHKFNDRPGRTSGQGGTVSWKSMFRGRAALFGGLQWQTPWQPWSIKVEYDGNDYRHEPAGQSNLASKSPVNIAAVYQAQPYMDWTLGLERGNKLMLGLSIHGDLSAAGMPKLRDPVPPAVQPLAAATEATEAAGVNNWAQTSRDIEAQTGWKVRALQQQGDALHVRLEDQGSTYRQLREDKVLAVLHRDAPVGVQQFVMDYANRQLAVQSRGVDRAAWVAQRTQALSPAQRKPEGQAHAVTSAQTPSAVTLWQAPQQAWSWDWSPSFSQSFGGPDAFMLYQAGIFTSAQWRLREDTWLSGGMNIRILDNYSKFKYTAPSKMPRVRTLVREYNTASRLTISNLQFNHVEQWGRDHFAAFYAGLLEPMYAGFGLEYLYRPEGARLAYGFDFNQVRQREFSQKFGLRPYRASTGHATAYWDTGWNDVLVKASLGQYLAQDKGVTLDISRRFANGVTFGAWATKTNVPSAQFGEGSFDKGLYLNFPLDVMLTQSSQAQGRLTWQPLLRDGGARLNRALELYELTAARDRLAFISRPSPTGPVVPQTGEDIFAPVR